MPDVPLLVDPDGPSVVSLRLHTDSDVPRIVEQCQDPLMQEWTTVPRAYTETDARRFVTEAMPGGWERGTEWGFAVDVDGRFGGTLNLRDEGGGRWELGYGAHPDVRGTGAIERAVRLLLAWAFDERGVRTVVWRANRGNWASRRLAWRLGFDITPTPIRAYLDHHGTLVDAWFGTLLAADERAPRTTWLDSPRIDSPRRPIRLRPFVEADLPRAVEADADAETQRWLAGGIAAHPTLETTRAFAMQLAETAAAGRGLTCAVAATDDDRLLGRVSLFDVRPVFGSAELGYGVHPDARGQGVATEAVRLLLRHAFVPEDDGGLGLLRVTAHAAVGNAPSRAVLTKAGMPEMRVVPLGTRTADGPTDAVLHEALARDWPTDRVQEPLSQPR